MKQAYCILPVYTADVSGVCSALYEFGGLVVMHDPSGCNSTYNTHDETRWFQKDSRIYISALTDRDAILGNDTKFLQDVQETAVRQKAAFIALASSPIPWMNGTDFSALARLLEERTGIPTFFVRTNGMHDYITGAGNALEMIAERFVVEDSVSSKEEHGEAAPEKRKHSDDQKSAVLLGNNDSDSSAWDRRTEGMDAFERSTVLRKSDQMEEKTISINVLGMTPLDFPTAGAADRMTDLLEEMGFSICSCWSMGKYAGSFRKAGDADVNLVVSATGLKAAKVLQQKFGTPYVAGIPVAGLEETVKTAILAAKQSGENQYPCRIRGKQSEKNTICIGEAVSMGSLAAAAALRTGQEIRVFCPLEGSEEVLAEVDVPFYGEEELQQLAGKIDFTAADPLYRYVLPDPCGEKETGENRWLELPHEAFSGRCFRKKMKHVLDVHL